MTARPFGRLPRRALTVPYAASVRHELGALRAAEAANAERARELQAKRLAALLRHAVQHVPYYRDAGVDRVGLDDDLGAFGLLRRFETLEKSVLRRSFDALKSDDLADRRWSVNTSGGSTGEPTRFVQDAAYGRWRRATKLLFDRWTGYRPGMPKVVLWGSERDLFQGRDGLRVRIVRSLRNEHFLNAFRMSPADMRAFAERITRVRPVQIRGYATSLYEFARFLQREAIEVPAPVAVLSSAGTLRHDMRESIAAAFGAPVYDRYGSREVGDVACEFVPREGLCISPLTHVVELLRSDGGAAEPGEVGEVVVTSLTNYAMPLIRYRIGDMAVWDDRPVPPGRPAWPRLREIVGRTTDVFRRADGGIVVPEYLIHMIGVVLNRGAIERFQVVQERHDHVRVLIVTSGPEDFGPDDTAELAAKIRHVMGADCRVDVERVDRLEPSPSGKFRTTISKVSPP